MKRTHKLKLLPGADGKTYIRIVARNGQIVGTAGQGYTRVANAERAARNLSGSTLIFEESKARPGAPPDVPV